MIGKFRDRISFYILSGTTSDGMGGHSGGTWTLFKEVWCDIKETFLSFSYENNKVKHYKKIIFTIRKNTDIDNNMKILYKSKYYIITSMYNDNKYNYIECLT